MDYPSLVAGRWESFKKIAKQKTEGLTKDFFLLRVDISGNKIIVGGRYDSFIFSASSPFALENQISFPDQNHVAAAGAHVAISSTHFFIGDYGHDAPTQEVGMLAAGAL